MNKAQSVHSNCLSVLEDAAPGIQRMALNSRLLYPDRGQHCQFKARLHEFLRVDTCAKVINYYDGVISYLTESVVPTKLDSRPPLLLLFGNPAPESVRRKCFFAGEKNRREHRFWQALRQSGIISFDEVCDDACKTLALLDLTYTSRFRIGLAVYYSMPSPASDPKWSGVAGLRRLFGARALREIADCEKRRLHTLVNKFVSGNPCGTVVAFQKDAYLAVKDDGSLEKVVEDHGKWRLIEAQCSSSEARLFRMPPTRYMNARWYVKFLCRVSEPAARQPKGNRSVNEGGII
ncbi:hypothetical protein ES707_14075 [subsurface metagenome]